MTNLVKKFGDFLNTIYICITNLKANHNKDYSVVKTFRVEPKVSLFFICIDVSFSQS